jgi:aspartyl protease family protein
MLGEWGRPIGTGAGIVIGWALRWVLLCCGIVLIGTWLLDHSGGLLPERNAPPGPAAPIAAAARPAQDLSNTIIYPANQRGHVVLEAAVNGAPVKMLVDTGASLVTLTQKDARAAGLSPRDLMFRGRVETANGSARMAPVTLREIRIGQLSIYEVPAAVMENLQVSLLGVSFLSRLQSYQMRDGKLAITW